MTRNILHTSLSESPLSLSLSDIFSLNVWKLFVFHVKNCFYQTICRINLRKFDVEVKYKLYRDMIGRNRVLTDRTIEHSSMLPTADSWYWKPFLYQEFAVGRVALRRPTVL